MHACRPMGYKNRRTDEMQSTLLPPINKELGPVTRLRADPADQGPYASEIAVCDELQAVRRTGAGLDLESSKRAVERWMELGPVNNDPWPSACTLPSSYIRLAPQWRIAIVCSKWSNCSSTNPDCKVLLL